MEDPLSNPLFKKIAQNDFSKSGVQKFFRNVFFIGWRLGYKCHEGISDRKICFYAYEILSSKKIFSKTARKVVKEKIDLLYPKEAYSKHLKYEKCKKCDNYINSVESTTGYAYCSKNGLAIKDIERCN